MPRPEYWKPGWWVLVPEITTAAFSLLSASTVCWEAAAGSGRATAPTTVAAAAPAAAPSNARRERGTDVSEAIADTPSLPRRCAVDGIGARTIRGGLRRETSVDGLLRHPSIADLAQTARHLEHAVNLGPADCRPLPRALANLRRLAGVVGPLLPVLGTANIVVEARPPDKPRERRVGRVELGVVSKILGHSNIATTADVYAHLTPAMSQRVADRLD